MSIYLTERQKRGKEYFVRGGIVRRAPAWPGQLSLSRRTVRSVLPFHLIQIKRTGAETRYPVSRIRDPAAEIGDMWQLRFAIGRNRMAFRG